MIKRVGGRKSQIVILTSKKAEAEIIAEALQCNSQSNSSFYNEECTILWLHGSVFKLPTIDRFYAQSRFDKSELVPGITSTITPNINRKKKMEYYSLVSRLKKIWASEFVIATTPDYNGELIARWFIKRTRQRAPLKRMWLTSLVKDDILKSFVKREDANPYYSFYKACKVRKMAEWLLSSNVTSCLSEKHQDEICVGWWHSLILNLISKREHSIATFTSREYYKVKVIVDGHKFVLKPNKLQNYSQVQQLLSFLEKPCKGKFKVKKVLRIRRTISAPLLYNLTDLQAAANSIYGYEPRKTNVVLLSLYMNHRLIKYPFTMSRYLPREIVVDIPCLLKKLCRITEFRDKIIGKTIDPTLLIREHQKAEHHGIIPTNNIMSLKKLSVAERNIYRLIIDRLIDSSTGPKAVVKKKIVIAKYRTRFVLDYSYYRDNKKLLNGQSISERVNKLVSGAVVKPASLECSHVRLQPLRRFTIAGMTSAMADLLSVPELKDELEIYAVGQTDAALKIGLVEKNHKYVKELIEEGQIELVGRTLRLTPRGKEILKIIPKQMLEISRILDFESDLTKLKSHGKSAEEVEDKLKEFIEDLVNTIKSDETKYNRVEKSIPELLLCPDCEREVKLIQRGKDSFYSCLNPGCSYTYVIEKVSKITCPTCHAKLMLRNDDEPYFYCVCGLKKNAQILKRMMKTERRENVSVVGE